MHLVYLLPFLVIGSSHNLASDAKAFLLRRDADALVSFSVLGLIRPPIGECKPMLFR